MTDILGSCGRQTILAKENRGENWELLGRQPIQFCVTNCTCVLVCMMLKAKDRDRLSYLEIQEVYHPDWVELWNVQKLIIIMRREE